MDLSLEKKLSPRMCLGVLVAVLLVWLPMSSLRASPAVGPPVVNQVVALLQGFEWHDDPAKFALLGEGTDRILMDIAANPQWHGVIRFRALAALRYYPNPQVALFLENLIGQNPSPDLVRRGLDAYAHAFGKNQPGKVAHLAEPLLEHDNPNVRMRAAQTLQNLPSGAVSLRVRQALDANAMANQDATSTVIPTVIHGEPQTR